MSPVREPLAGSRPDAGPPGGPLDLGKRYLLFCAVGGSGLLVDMVLFHLLHTRAGWPLEVSKLLAAETALLNNFLWNDRWTFGHRPVESHAPWQRRLFRFHVICLSGIALATVLLAVMHRMGGLRAEVANFVAIVLVSGWNFGWSRRWGWASGRSVGPATPPRPADGPARP
ncbi:MAG: GtrA family protein [Verrucomicrobiota bacterium]